MPDSFLKIPNTPRFLIYRVRDVLLYYGFDYSELQRAVMMLCWGLWVVNPFISLVKTDPHYWSPISRWAPLWCWGGLFAVIGAYQMWAVLVNSKTHRRKATFVAFLLWIFLWLLFIQVTFSSTAVPLYFLFALENAWGYIRMRR